jgi:Family of unknown function (DUF5906)/RepB DNA-primase from phage plasmid
VIAIVGNTDAAVDFLCHWHGDRDRVVITIDPVSNVTVRRDFLPALEDKMRGFIEAAQGRQNIYTLVNPGRGGTSPTKAEMTAARALHVDADLKDLGGDKDAALARLRALNPPPGIITFSGGGYWPLWRLTKLYNGSADWREKIERANAMLHQAAGANPACRNVNRLMRLPGTINVLNEKKRKEGREPALAYVVEADWERTFELEDFDIGDLPAPNGRDGDVPAPAGPLRELPPGVMKVVNTGAADRWGGDRSSAVFSVACCAVRAGWPDEAIAELLLNPNNKISVHVCEQSQPAKYAARQAARARQAVEEPILELNKAFAVVRVANKAAILNEHLDGEGKPTFSLLSPDSFRLLIANNQSVDANDWIASPLRREYEGITFAPAGSPPGYYNLWRGFAVKPSESGSCELFKAHLKENVCQGSEELFAWVFGWFADIFQHPAEKCGTSLVLRGKMGVGKSIVGDTFGHLLGTHYVQTADPRYVTGRFNAHLVRCLLFHCDEAFWAGDRAAEGKLKDLVTGKRHPIELKGFEVFFVPNFVRLFVNGNPNWLVPAGMEERRFGTLDVGEAHMQDIPYFRAIAEELNRGGYERLLFELLSFDLSQVELRVIPKTDALLDQKIETLPPEKAWWLDVLKNGRLPWCDLDNPAKCPGKALFNSYINHTKTTGIFRRKIETAIGMFIRTVVPKDAGFYTKVESYTFPTALGIEVDRGTVYTFPPLVKCRQAFDEMLGQNIKWEGPEAWDARNSKSNLDETVDPY